ncbi:MAG: hypothetical protein WC554_01835 [Clostridia bacterium]
MKRNENILPEKKSNHSELFITELLRSDGFLILNKRCIQIFGLKPAIILSNYIDKYIYFKTNSPENNGWFFLTHDTIQDQLQIGERTIINAKNLFKELGIIKTKIAGLPAKEWLQIDFEAFIEIYANNEENSPCKNDGTIPCKNEGVLRRTNIKENKLNKSSLSRARGNSKFIIPTLEEVREYCTQRKNNIDPEAFIDFYTSKGWKIGNTPMKDWKAAVRTWEKKEKFYTSNNNLNTLSKYRKPSNGNCQVNPSKKDYDTSTIKILNTKNQSL